MKRRSRNALVEMTQVEDAGIDLGTFDMIEVARLQDTAVVHPMPVASGIVLRCP